MLLQLENTDQGNIDKLIAFAGQNQMKLSKLDENGDDYFLPGKPLSPGELTEFIEAARNSGMITMENAHKIIRTRYNAD